MFPDDFCPQFSHNEVNTDSPQVLMSQPLEMNCRKKETWFEVDMGKFCCLWSKLDVMFPNLRHVNSSLRLSNCRTFVARGTLEDFNTSICLGCHYTNISRSICLYRFCVSQETKRRNGPPATVSCNPDHK